MNEDLTRKDLTDILAESSGNRLDKKDEPYIAEVIQNNEAGFRDAVQKVKRQDDVKAAIYLGTINEYVHKKPKSRAKGSSFRLVSGLASLTFQTQNKALRLLGYAIALSAALAGSFAVYSGAKMYTELKILQEKNERKQKTELKLYDKILKMHEEQKTE